jgi:hypothetical protein
VATDNSESAVVRCICPALGGISPECIERQCRCECHTAAQRNLFRLGPNSLKGSVAEEVGQALRLPAGLALDRLALGRGDAERELLGGVLWLRHLVAVAVEAVSAAAVVFRLAQPRPAVPLRVRQLLLRVVGADLRDVRVDRFFSHTPMLDVCLTEFYIACYTQRTTYPQSVCGSKTNV